MAARSSTRTVSLEPLSPGAPLLTKYATEAMRVMDRAAPARYAATFCCHFSLVARKMAVRICGPAIITNANGRLARRFTVGAFRSDFAGERFRVSLGFAHRSRVGHEAVLAVPAPGSWASQCA
jgi:hypothetical protein